MGAGPPPRQPPRPTATQPAGGRAGLGCLSVRLPGPRSFDWSTAAAEITGEKGTLLMPGPASGRGYHNQIITLGRAFLIVGFLLSEGERAH